MEPKECMTENMSKRKASFMEKKSHKGGSAILSKDSKHRGTGTTLAVKKSTSKASRVKKEVSGDRTSEGETRATFIIEELLLNRLKAIAYWERKQIKAVLKEALDLFIKEKGEAYVEHALEEQRNSGQG
jgi:hypothetical protein